MRKGFVVVFALPLLLSWVAAAADYPSRPVTIVVGASAGGAADAQARLIAKTLSQRLGQPVVVDNRAGAGGRLAAQLVARAPADGHTLFLCSTSILVIEPLLRTNVGYDPQRDFAAVAMVGELPLVLVASPTLPINTLDDLIKVARQRPGQLTEVGNVGEINAALDRISKAPPDGLLVSSEVLFIPSRQEIIKAVARIRLPTVFPWRVYAVDGGLSSYGASNEEGMRRVAAYADRVLKGAKPWDLPVEQLATFHLVANLKTAKAQGITIPESFLLRADELIR